MLRILYNTTGKFEDFPIKLRNAQENLKLGQCVERS